MNVGTFAAILTMRVKGQMVEGIEDLAGLGRNNPMLALVLAVFLFSLAGIPPLAGFFGKFYVFLAAIEAELYTPRDSGCAVQRCRRVLLLAHYQGDVLRRTRRIIRASDWTRDGHHLGCVWGIHCIFRGPPRPVSCPGPRQRAAATPSLNELPSGFFIRHASEEVASTNDIARELAETGAPEGTLVTARRQHSGRGRRGNTWESIEGNVFLSLILRPDVDAQVAAQLSFVAAVTVGDLVANLLPDCTVQLKWPNDVLCDGKKISGILLEAGPSGAARVEWLIVGIGLNVASKPTSRGGRNLPKRRR